MRAGWRWFRMICVLQVVNSSLLLFTSFIRFIQYPAFGGIFRLVLFLLILLLAVFSINLLNNNYPDNPVTGSQKKMFNRLFLLNFVFLSVLFGLIFSEFAAVERLAYLIQTSILRLPFRWLSMLIVYLLTLVFQFIILLGLYNLRRVLYRNFGQRKFEFEK